MWKIIPIVWLATALTITPLLSKWQTTEKDNIKQKKQTELVDNFTTTKLNHNEIITKNIKDILQEYGEEKWLEIINKHLMIEMNKIRREQNIPELTEVDQKLKDFAQKQAIFLDKEWKIYHMKWEDILWKRLKKDNFEFWTCWENLALWHDTIQEVIEWRLNSPTHKANILKKTYKKMWLWYKNETWVLNRTN